MVGAVVLPILGAVPDGMVVLFSGIGPNAQTQLQVGIGALAGSTVMLLSLNWPISIVGGAVNLSADKGEPIYKVNKGYKNSRLGGAEQDADYGLFSTGVGVHANPESIRVMTMWMIITILPMVVIQARSAARDRLRYISRPLVAWALIIVVGVGPGGRSAALRCVPLVPRGAAALSPRRAPRDDETERRRPTSTVWQPRCRRPRRERVWGGAPVERIWPTTEDGADDEMGRGGRARVSSLAQR